MEVVRVLVSEARSGLALSKVGGLNGGAQ